MTQVNFNLKVDNDNKVKFDAICSKLGISATSVMYIFYNKFISEEGFPFDLRVNDISKKIMKFSLQTAEILKDYDPIKNTGAKNEDEAFELFMRERKTK